MEYAVDELAMKKITKSKTKKRIRTNISWSILKIKDNMSEKSKRLLQLTRQMKVSNWLPMLPMAEYGFELSKQQFWDSTSLRFIQVRNLKITNASMWKQI